MNRMHNFFLAALFASSGFNSYGQEKVAVENYELSIPNEPKQGKPRHAKITLINGQKLQGVITSIGDNSIQLEKVVYKNTKEFHPAADKSLQYNEVVYSDIHSIKIRGTII